MRTPRLGWIFTAILAFVALTGSVAAKRSVQTKSELAQTAKSSDPSIRWQFDTHG